MQTKIFVRNNHNEISICFFKYFQNCGLVKVYIKEYAYRVNDYDDDDDDEQLKKNYS